MTSVYRAVVDREQAARHDRRANFKRSRLRRKHPDKRPLALSCPPPHQFGCNIGKATRPGLDGTYSRFPLKRAFRNRCHVMGEFEHRIHRGIDQYCYLAIWNPEAAQIAHDPYLKRCFLRASAVSSPPG